jgi:hypothetical protein
MSEQEEGIEQEQFMDFNFEASREEPLSKGYQHYTSFQKSQTETSLL